MATPGRTTLGASPTKTDRSKSKSKGAAMSGDKIKIAAASGMILVAVVFALYTNGVFDSGPPRDKDGQAYQEHGALPPEQREELKKIQEEKQRIEEMEVKPPSYEPPRGS